MKVLSLWITGLPGSGKSTVAEGIRRRYPDFVLLRMDELRKVVTPEPTYSEEERELVYRCLVYTASKLAESGRSVIIDATGNLRRWRDLARKTLPGYAEIYLKCPLELCIERERGRDERFGAPEEIYRKGEAGWPVPGVSAPYEEPLNPELVIETGESSVAETLKRVEDFIAARLNLDRSEAEQVKED